MWISTRHGGGPTGIRSALCLQLRTVMWNVRALCRAGLVVLVHVHAAEADDGVARRRRLVGAGAEAVRESVDDAASPRCRAEAKREYAESSDIQPSARDALT